MLRYTALLHTSAHPVDLPGIKQAVENVLLRAYSPITYRLGSMVEVRHGLVLVEIASDARKEYVTQLLKQLENKYPLEVKEVGWGWTLTKNSPPTGPDEIHTGVDTDPYACQIPESAREVVYRLPRGQRIRLAFTIVCLAALALATLALLASYLLNNPLGIQADTFQELFFFILFPLWVILGLINGLTPSLLIWRYPTQISCDTDGIHVAYWLGFADKYMAWTDIQSLEIGYSNCTIRNGSHSLRFQFRSEYGRNDYPGLVPTIAARASLNFVGALRGAIQYKRFASP